MRIDRQVHLTNHVRRQRKRFAAKMVARPIDVLAIRNFLFARRSAGRAIVISCCTVFPAARGVSKQAPASPWVILHKWSFWLRRRISLDQLCNFGRLVFNNVVHGTRDQTGVHTTTNVDSEPLREEGNHFGKR